MSSVECTIQDLEQKIDRLEKKLEHLTLLCGKHPGVIIYVSAFGQDDWSKYYYAIYSEGKEKPLEGSGKTKRLVKVAELLALSMALDTLRMVAPTKTKLTVRVSTPQIRDLLLGHAEIHEDTLKEKVEGVVARMNYFDHVFVDVIDAQDPMADDIANRIQEL